MTVVEELLIKLQAAKPMCSSSVAQKLTVQASQVKDQEYHRQQGLGVENYPLWLPWQCLTRWQYKGTSTSLCSVHGATQEPESGKILEERKWIRFLDDPSMWWDKRATYWNNYPYFNHAFTGESLWIGSSYCTKRVQPWLKCRCMNAQYRESGRTTKVTVKDGRETFRNCNEIQQQKVETNMPILLNALRASSSSRDLESGKKLHANAIESGDDSNIYVASTLVAMYTKCGSMGDARGVFDRMPRHNVVAWNALMLGYAENGEGKVALELFASMRVEGCAPNRVTFLAALKACTSLAAKEDGTQVYGRLVKIVSLEKGMAIHFQASKSCSDSDIYVASTLVDMYTKCGSMGDARGVFDKMARHNAVAWNAMMLGYAENREGEVALQLFARMQFGGCAPNRVTFLAALKACTSLAAKEDGKQVVGKLVKLASLDKGMAIHSQAAKSAFESEIYVANTLVDMYAKCGSMEDARGVFDRMPCHYLVSWNALLLGYAENEEGEVALQLFARMSFEGCAPDGRTFVAALKACTVMAAKEEGNQVHGTLVKIRSMEKGMAIHSQATKRGCGADIFVASTLVDMYAKCGSMVDAQEVFDRMPLHDVVSWNALMLGYAENGEGEVTLHLFARMRCGCAQDARNFVAAVKACTSLAAKEEGKQVDGKLVKMGSLDKGMAIHSQAARSGCDSEIYVANTLVDMYAKCGSMVDARGVFDRMARHDVVSWNALMLGYVENGEGEVALQLFGCEGCAPDARTFVAALKACGSMAALDIGKTIHSEICRCGLDSNGVIGNSLVDFYGKCGSMVDAQQVFDSLATKDLVSWTALIAGYSRQGDTKNVFDVFEKMQKEQVQANGITFLSILTACSHAGLVDKGKEYFLAMRSKYGVNPGIEHYHCMVDILGRANQLDDAVAMVKTMPFKPNAVTWTTVLGACRKWKNVVVGRLAFESLLRLDEGEPAAYVLMSNIYGSVGMWEEKSKVQAMHGLGRSQDEFGGQMRKEWCSNFVVGDEIETCFDQARVRS